MVNILAFSCAAFSPQNITGLDAGLQMGKSRLLSMPNHIKSVNSVVPSPCDTQSCNNNASVNFVTKIEHEL